MRIAIIQFPGSNCERETMLAVQRAGMQPEEFLWNSPLEKLNDFQGFIIVGGFSYEDRSRAGIIAALDPIMDRLKIQSRLGKPILGICNGAQILVESGLVPGIENDQVGLALTDNIRVKNGHVLGTGYYNAWINMRVSDDYQLNAFTRYLQPKNILQVPVAHAEGRFVIPAALLSEMQILGLSLFQYCDSNGNIHEEFPINPNGSVANIAAISNKNGNVMAMMPHPERTQNSDAIFNSMRDYIKEGFMQTVLPLNYYPRHRAIEFHKQKNHEWLVELIITDNHAMSVQNRLDHLKINASIKRFLHWEIECDSENAITQIKNSEVLFNHRKEKLVSRSSIDPNMIPMLIRSKEDMIGKQKKQLLENHFGIPGIRAIRHGVVWGISGEKNILDPIINSQILFNPYAHDYYYY